MAPSAETSVEEKMRYKLKTAAGKALYAARKHIVEPVFGMTKSVGIRKFLLRGLEKVSAEWQLICLTHNLLKIWCARQRSELKRDSVPRAGPRPKGQGPAKTQGQCATVRKFSDKLLAVAPQWFRSITGHSRDRLVVAPGLGALGGRLLAKQASHLAPGLMSTVLDGGKVDRRSGLINGEEFFLDHPEKPLKTGILGRIGRRRRNMTILHDRAILPKCHAYIPKFVAFYY